MKYDPNWLNKLKAKKINEDLNSLSHLPKNSERRTMLCGKGWGAKGHPSIITIMFPSVTNLPGCRTCREIFLTSINVQFDDRGYPLSNPSNH